MTGPSAVAGRRVRLTILTTVRAEGPARSRLETEVDGEATSVEGVSSQPVACATNGRLELELHQLIEKLVRGWIARRNPA
ncbi:MAG TPA: hypothetical protein VD793_11375 [Gemmatimonadales bacterium]|nr:hypothetical protein [Gemmatimonadales bacterium]